MGNGNREASSQGSTGDEDVAFVGAVSATLSDEHSEGVGGGGGAHLGGGAQSFEGERGGGCGEEGLDAVESARRSGEGELGDRVVVEV